MLPLRRLHGIQCVCREPTITLWPDTATLISRQLEDAMLSMISQIERGEQRPHLAQHLLANQLQMPRRPNLHEENSPCASKDGKEDFQLTLDMRPFSPEELIVTTAGRRLTVTGKHQAKKETEKSGFFQEYREWRREAELPEDVNPEDVLCSLSEDGYLHFRAPRLALPPSQERAIPITIENSSAHQGAAMNSPAHQECGIENSAQEEPEQSGSSQNSS